MPHAAPPLVPRVTCRRDWEAERARIASAEAEVARLLSEQQALAAAREERLLAIRWGWLPGFESCLGCCEWTNLSPHASVNPGLRQASLHPLGPRDTATCKGTTCLCGCRAHPLVTHLTPRVSHILCPRAWALETQPRAHSHVRTATPGLSGTTYGIAPPCHGT